MYISTQWTRILIILATKQSLLNILYNKLIRVIVSIVLWKTCCYFCHYPLSKKHFFKHPVFQWVLKIDPPSYIFCLKWTKESPLSGYASQVGPPCICIWQVVCNKKKNEISKNFFVIVLFWFVFLAKNTSTRVVRKYTEHSHTIVHKGFDLTQENEKEEREKKVEEVEEVEEE